MKTKITISLLVTAIFLFITNVSKAQWSPGTGYVYPTTTTNNVIIGSSTTPLYPLQVNSSNIVGNLSSGDSLAVGISHNTTTAVGMTKGLTRHAVFGATQTVADILFVNKVSSTYDYYERMRINRFGRVGIGTPAPDTSALLDISSTNKGLLIPRIALVSVTDAATITLPATSLLVYNTGGGGLSPAGYYYNAGNTTTANWVMFGTSNGWALTGNTLTGTLPSSPSQFIGTINAADWIIKTTNTERMRVLSGGNVGIGATAPNEHLAIEGTGNQSLSVYSTTTGVVGTARTFLQLFGQNTASTKIEQARISSAPGAIASTAGQFILSTNNSSNALTERLRVDETGNLGIGTNAPADHVAIEGSGDQILSIYSTSTGAVGTPRTFIKLFGQNTVGTKKEQARISSAPGANASNAGQFILSTNNTSSTLTERLRVDENGYVGIGTTTPSTLLHITATSSTNSAITLTRNVNTMGSYLSLYTGATSDWILGTRGTSDSDFHLYSSGTSANVITAMRANGKVGIGTDAPVAQLEVDQNSANTDANLINVTNTATNGTNQSANITLQVNANATGTGYLRVNGSAATQTKGTSSDMILMNKYTAYPLAGNLLLGTHDTVRMTILHNGNVGIGTTSPGYKLHVVGNSRFTSDMYLDGQGYYAVGMPWIASDSIFKISIDTLHNALATIKQLKPKSYYLDTANVYGLNFSKKKQYGFIAQEIETILPELITETTKPADYDTTGNVINPALTYKSLNYGAFFGILAKGIQEQSNEIDSLKTKTNNKDSISTALQQAQQQSIDSLRTITASQDSINVSLQNSLNQLIVKTNYQDSINTSLQDQLNQLLNCCNNNGNNGHGNNLMPSGTHNSEQNNRSIDANDGNLQKTTLTDVELSNKNIVVLNQNVPNPFAEQTTITYFLPDNVTRPQIIFFEQSGKIIKTIDLTEKGKGQLNVFANDLSSGIYTYSLIVDGQIVETKKMVKAK